MNYIIAPFYIHNALKKYYMEQDNKEYLINYTFIDPHQFINSYIKEIKEPNYIQLNNTLKELNLVFFKDYIYSYKFIKYYFNKLKNLTKYNVDINLLDTSTIYNKEIKSILLAFNKYDFNEKYYSNIKDELNKLDFSNYIIYDTKPDIFTNEIYNILLNNNATLFKDKDTINNLYIHKALNSRTEIESIAQMIIDNNIYAKDINLVCPNSYNVLVKQIFDRYNIPIYFNNYRVNSNINKNYVLLVKYLMNNTNTNLINAIKSNAFNISNTNKYIIKYLELLDNNIILDNEFNYYKNLDNINLSLINDLRRIEEEAEIYRQLILEQINIIELDDLNIESILQKVITYYDNNDNKKIINKIVKTIESNAPFDNDQIDIILDLINDLNVNYQNEYTNSVTITDINNPILKNEYTFVLGLNQSNYPGFTSESGYINEKYLSESNYPSEKTRFNNHMNRLKWLLNNSNNIYLSYSITGFDGSNEELSFYIEELFKDNIKFYPIKHNEITNRKLKYNINHDLIREKLLDNNVISTNVYKLETFYSCQCAFFLKYIIKLKEPINIYDYKISLGTLNHKISELYVSNNFKLSDKEIIDLNNELFDTLKILFPKLIKRIDILKERNLNNIKLNLEQMKINNERSLFKPLAFEHQIKHTYNTDKCDVLIDGRIDRIDQYDNKIAIIDYKSSSKTINNESVNSCKSLQLPIYLDAYTKIENKVPNACLYYEFNFENIKLDDYKLQRGKFLSENLKLNSNNLNKQLVGLIMNTPKDIDDSKRNSSALIEFNQEELNKMFNDFSTNILNGSFEIDPKVESCKNCNFKRICNFNGFKLNYKEKFKILYDKNKGEANDNK